MQLKEGHVLALVGTPDDVAGTLRQLGYVNAQRATHAATQTAGTLAAELVDFCMPVAKTFDIGTPPGTPEAAAASSLLLGAKRSTPLPGAGHQPHCVKLRLLSCR